MIQANEINIQYNKKIFRLNAKSCKRVIIINNNKQQQHVVRRKERSGAFPKKGKPGKPVVFQC